MKGITVLKGTAIFGLAILAGGISSSAAADRKFDGFWWVDTVATEGDCNNHRVKIGVWDGKVSLAGQSVESAGSVGPNGRLKASFIHQGDHITVSGALKGAAGKGSWTSSGCTGTWSAQRS